MYAHQTPAYSKLRMQLKQLLCLPLLALYYWADKTEIDADVAQWTAKTPHRYRQQLLFFLADLPAFRTLFYYRLQRSNIIVYLLSRLLKRFYPAQVGLDIYCNDIATGLFIEHGNSSIIGAASIGQNCHVNQQVTIGMKRGKCPVIGNSVAIHAGATVLGDITLGDGCIVGAGAVVLQSVPPGAIVAGVPARIKGWVQC